MNDKALPYIYIYFFQPGLNSNRKENTKLKKIKKLPQKSPSLKKRKRNEPRRASLQLTPPPEDADDGHDDLDDDDDDHGGRDDDAEVLVERRRDGPVLRAVLAREEDWGGI